MTTQAEYFDKFKKQSNVSESDLKTVVSSEMREAIVEIKRIVRSNTSPFGKDRIFCNLQDDELHRLHVLINKLDSISC